MTRKPLVAGNWKMNGLKASVSEAKRLMAALARNRPRCEVLVCPPATVLALFAQTTKGSLVRIGGQDCHPAASGAYTGDIGAEMLKDAGARAVIVGHSERRQYHGEQDALVRAKAQAAHRASLAAIICVGETAPERDAGETLAIVSRQVGGSLPDGATAKNTILAYEPVWAIGTGRTPTGDEIIAVHQSIRSLLARRFGAEAEGMRILYGGSVKPDNAAAILRLPDVDGALVGGASLKARDFLDIVSVYAR